jgi:ABC-type branched-subunit amino acid transport system substrate-binding protein
VRRSSPIGAAELTVFVTRNEGVRVVSSDRTSPPASRARSVGRVIRLPLRAARVSLAATALVTLVATCGCGTTVRTASLNAQGGIPASGDGLSAGSASSGPGGPTAPGAVPSGLAPGGPGVAAPGAVGASAPGPAAAPGRLTPSGSVTSPIEVGVLYAVNDGAQSAGVDNGNTFTLSRAMRALVDSYNHSGGLGGRRIDPVYAEVHSASNDYDSQFQAACATFTQDHHVALVVTAVGFYSDTLLTCLTKAGVPIVGADYTAPDRVGAGQYPSYLTPTVPLADTRYADEVARMTASGFLTRTSRIGVVIEGCPVDDRVYKKALEPALRGAGLTVTATSRTRCFMSLQDLGGMASDTQNAVLQFRSQNVDRVMFVSESAEGNLVLVFAEAADAQKYTPGYVLDSTGAPAVLAANLPQSQLVNMHGVGWIPSLDSQDRAQLRPTPADSACLSRFKHEGIQPTSNADFNFAYSTCDGFGFSDAVLRVTRGNAAEQSFIGALDAIGSSFHAATTVDSRVVVSRSRRAGAGAGRLFAFAGGCSCFRYAGPSFPL